MMGQQDIFNDIARNIFTKRSLPVDEQWAIIIAEEYRLAMADLDVQVKPKGPAPKATRTKNGTLFSLLAALENGDIWVRDCLVPVTQHDDGAVSIASSLLTFDCGLFSVEARYYVDLARHLIGFGCIEAIALPKGQRLTSDHPDRAWLKAYAPTPELDVFSPMVQYTLDKLPVGSTRWTVFSTDANHRTWKFVDTGGSRYEAKLWKDARGREL
jgi:hypothetical protein